MISNAKEAISIIARIARLNLSWLTTRAINGSTCSVEIKVTKIKSISELPYSKNSCTETK
jgi:hypothetical protein